MVEESGQLTVKSSALHSMTLMLGFLATMWHSDTRGSLHPQTTTSLFALLVQQFIVQMPTCLPSQMLQDTLLTALATAEALRVDPAFGDVPVSWEDETIWRLSLRSGSTNLVSSSEFSTTLLIVHPSNMFFTAAFVYYLQATKKIHNALCFAEAWNYLRDVLLLVLSHHFLGDDEPLGLLVCPAICRGLLLLLENANSPASRPSFMMFPK
jgi:hypothetical protein